jgi:hypothetical protein
MKMKWYFYSGQLGFRGEFSSIREAYDFSLKSFQQAIRIWNGQGADLSIKDFSPKTQPFSNNERIGKFTGGMLSKLNGTNCLFELPDESTNMHIVLLTHLGDESHYLIRSDVTKFYFGDEDWALYRKE